MNTPPQDLLDLAERVVANARREGADEVVVAVSLGSHVTLQRRARKVEQATEATTRGLSLSILAGDRIGHFVSCVLVGKKPIIPIEESLKVQQVLDAIYLSAETGKEVRLGGK